MEKEPAHASSDALLGSAYDRSRRLAEALRRQEAELAADGALNAAGRDAGLGALRRAAAAAAALAEDLQSSVEAKSLCLDAEHRFVEDIRDD
jgi:hypothetical protein